MTERIRESLARARATAYWTDLAYAPAADADPDEDGNDENLGRRALVLWGLQYDHGPADLPLVRWLAEQEAAFRWAEGGGLGNEAELAGFLLATYREVEDVWRHWAIKRSNFDAGTAYDAEYLVAAGPAETIAYVRASDHPKRAELLEYLLKNLADAELTDWWGDKREWFPADPADEHELTWFDRAQLLGDRDAAHALLLRWADGRDRDEETLTSLYYRLVELGYHDEAADAARARITLLSDPSALDLTIAYSNLAEQERAAGRYPAALAALRAWGTRDGADLGVSYVRELFLLARDADGEVAAAAFAEGDRAAPSVLSRLSFEVLDAAAKTAATVGAHDRAAAYGDLRDAEPAR